MRSRFLLGTLALLWLSMIVGAAEPFQPDPNSVRRYGPAYRYPQAGWTVLHIEGEPFDRGYQHGRLMATEIVGYLKALAAQQSSKSPSDGWKLTRTLVSANFLRKFDREYLEEMRGIADGATAAGATYDGRAIDLLDIAAINVSPEYDTMEAGLNALPTGLEGVRFPKPAGPNCCKPESKDHCSAFAATGPATADGKIVFGHITMFGLYSSNYYNIWLDVKPSKGHRIVMQSYPGGIQSGMDYYINSAGLMVTETTIEQTKFNPDGVPLANRIRKALQYTDSIDDFAKVVMEKNNGLYANEWIIGDAKTNEIAILELGTTATRLRRSSKNEWLVKGAEGFYWGCNNIKDLQVRLDTVSSLVERPQDMSWNPSVRDKAWLKIYDQYKGKIDAEFGKKAFTTSPLAASHSLDAKVTTTDMSKKMESIALFGPPMGKVWTATFDQKTEFPDIQPLVPNPWTILTPLEPKKMEVAKVADLFEKVSDSDDEDSGSFPSGSPAWNGTLLPKSDADLWITAGFAAYERIVAGEKDLKEKSEGKLSDADKQKVEDALFRYRSDYLSAKAAQPKRKGGTSELSPIAKELDRDRWHKEQVALGVLTLDALRKFIGAEKFDAAMAAYGKENAGKEIEAQDFTAKLGADTKKDVAGFLKTWLENPAITGAAYQVHSWLSDPANAIIVYGTLDEEAANKEAALVLQNAVRTRFWNLDVPVVSDKEATPAELKEKHVVLIGRPSTNQLSAQYAKSFPVEFGAASFKVKGKTYGHEGSAVVAAGTNPLNPKYGIFILAGLSTDSTYRLPESLMKKGDGAAEVLVVPNKGGMKSLVVTPTKLKVEVPVSTK